MKNRRFLTMLRLSFVLILLSLLMLPTHAEAASESDLIFTLNSDGQSYSVTDCNSSASGALVIPATYNDKPVTTIGDSAFSSCSGLTAVTIPDSVTTIGWNAFARCRSLTSITIGVNVTNIDTWAFMDCTGLTDVYIADPSAWCKINFSDTYSNPMNYADCLHILDEGGNEVTDITLDDTVTTIPAHRFRNGKYLTSITIPDSVTSIDRYAFSGCTNLNYNRYNNAKYLGNTNNPYLALITVESDSIESCTIHNDTQTIAGTAFYDCTSLTSITIPDSVTTVGGSAFEGCTGLTAVYITDIAAWCNIEFYDSYANPLECYADLYLNGELVTDLVIPNNMTSIGNYTFYGCTSLISITIPDSVTTIGGAAFSYCTKLTSVTISDSVTSIGGSAFHGCASLTSVTIPDNVASIGNYAFSHCSKLTNITIPKSVKTIGEYAFYGCGNLTHVWYGGSENDRSSITGDKPTATWHYNCCNSDSHTYDNTCDDSCNFCSYPREVSHLYDDADDMTCNLCKQTLAPVAPTVQSVTDTTVTLYAIDGYEYSMDEKTWQISNVFFGLQPTTSYKFYQRVAEGTDNLTSPASKPLTVQTDKYVPDIPWGFTFVEITDTSVRLNEVADCEYSIDGGTWQTSPVFTNLTPGTRYAFYQRIAENSKHYASDNAILHITTYSKLGTITYNSNGGQDAPGVTTGKISTQTPTRSGYKFMGWALTPITHAVYQPGDRYSHQEDITLYAVWTKLCSNCSGSGEYIHKCSHCSGTGIGSTVRCSPCGGTGTVYEEESCTYGDCVGGKFIVSETQIIDCPICKGDGICDVPIDCSNCYGTGSLTYSCSTCSGQGYWLSICSQCVSGVQKFTPETPQIPKLQSVSSNTVVLVYYSTCEYSIDSINWQDSNVFSNLDVNKTYLFYQRYKATACTNHSNASQALSVTTLKERVLPPQRPVLQSKAFNKVILEKVDGCEYSLDGINWQTSNVFDDLRPLTSYTFFCRFAETATHSYSAASDGLTVVTEQSPLYSVVFVDWNGTVISSNTYRWGDEIAVPANPTKAADNTYTYTFSGWNKEVVPCAGDAVYTAIYDSYYIDYTVVFKDWDGTVLSTSTYHWGEEVVAPADPSRAADETYTYTFIGWDKTVVNCAGNTTYTATYDATYINYTVEFRDWDGTILSTSTYHWGEEVVAPADPSRVADETYTYTFIGWDKSVVNCAGDATYTATYDATYINYTVEFRDWDGTVLFTNTYHWGDEIVIPADPSRAADETYTYTFVGWDKSVVNCAGNAVYTATYEPVYIEYTVEFKDWDGVVISLSTYHWGDTIVIPSNPSRTTDGTYKYSFSGWGTEIQTCTGNATYTAAYEAVKLLNGWVQESDKWYYYKNDVKQTGWLQSGNTWYFLNGNGVMLTGWQQINGIWYYFTVSGAMQTGWLQSGSTWYYLKSSGAMATGWENISGIYYFFNSSGVMQTGWLKSGNTWYYLKSSGAMATGWEQVSGKWYYFNASGAMITGWQKIGNTWYYFQSSGAMQTSWLKLGNTWYYFHSSGAMATGSVKVGAKTYNFNSSGACLNP